MQLGRCSTTQLNPQPRKACLRYSVLCELSLRTYFPKTFFPNYFIKINMTRICITSISGAIPAQARFRLGVTSLSMTTHLVVILIV